MFSLFSNIFNFFQKAVEPLSKATAAQLLTQSAGAVSLSVASVYQGTGAVLDHVGEMAKGR
ncbi:MAG: hypothetical protein J5896_01830 [Alphaproteobacteria bacterium]|nr:hypothetical protein [Alphaproteobacteria bacterium]